MALFGCTVKHYEESKAFMSGEMVEQKNGVASSAASYLPWDCPRMCWLVWFLVVPKDNRCTHLDKRYGQASSDIFRHPA